MSPENIPLYLFESFLNFQINLLWVKYELKSITQSYFGNFAWISQNKKFISYSKYNNDFRRFLIARMDRLEGFPLKFFMIFESIENTNKQLRFIFNLTIFSC